MISLVLGIGLAHAAPPTCGEWVRDQVQNISGAMEHASIALGQNGRPHIAWYSSADGQTRYAVRGNAGWKVEVVGLGRADFVVDGNIAHLALSHCDSSGKCMVHLGIRERDGWEVRPVLEVSGPISPPSMVVDARGLPHFAYYAIGDGRVRVLHATPVDGVWRQTPVSLESTTVGPPQIMAHPDGSFHVVFDRPHKAHAIVHARWKPGESWKIQSSSPGRGRDLDLLYGDVGALYLGYFRGGQRIAIQTPRDGWVQYGEPRPGTGTVSVGKDGAPQLAVVEDVEPLKRLEWVRWGGAGWDEELVAADPQGFRSVAMALDARGCPHILYQHSDSSITVYARKR